MNDRSKGTYLGQIYIPVPFLFDEADYIYDANLLCAEPWFSTDFLDNDLLMNRYVTKDWLLGDVPVGVVR